MMKTLIITLLFAFELSLGFSQNIETDSLKHELSISKADTHRVMLLTQISGYFGAINIDSGIYYAQQSLALSREIAFAEGEAEALGILAWHLRTSGNNSKALELYLKQFKIADKNHFFKQKGDALRVMGMIYRDAFKDTDKGLKFLYKARAIYDSIQDFNGLTQVETIIGYTYIPIKQLDSADYYLRLAEQHNIQYNINFNSVLYRFKGHFYKERGDTRKAIYYYNQSLKAAYVDRNNLESCVNNLSLGIIYRDLNQLDSAIYFTTTALKEAQKVNSYNNIIRSATLLHDLNRKTNPIKALEYLEIASAAKDSVQEKSISTALKSILDIDAQESQYEIDTAKKEYRNNIRQYGLLAGLVVFSFIGLILYRNNRQKQKVNILLQEQKEKVETTLSQLRSTQTQLIQKEKLASLGELTAGIAHEIQNPLNFVNNFSELSGELLDEMEEEIDKGNAEEVKAISSDLKQNLQKINHHGKRASSIVKGMLEHSRMSTGERQLTDLNALCDEYLRLSYHGMRAKDKDGSATRFNADYELIADPNLPKVNIVPQDIGRVLLNLINNAFYAAYESKKSQPKVIVSSASIAQSDGNTVIIRVKDNGTGIPKENLAKIFQPFFTTKPTGEGTGLGLSLAYDIVTKGHGGTIEVESVEGEGTTFIIKLPIK
ncbi:MAG: ATP-binding protein [Spirosomataceae bacterium]